MISKIMSSLRPTELVFAGPNGAHRLEVRRNRQSRGYRLRIDPRSGAPVLTLPERAPLAPALAWAATKKGWIEAALGAVPVRNPIGPGGEIPFGGTMLRIDWQPDLPRKPQAVEDAIRLGGPIEAVERRVLAWLRAEARTAMLADAAYFAERAGCPLGTIAITDPRSRWGSCTATGAIRLSWRLIMAPAFVRRSVVAHEIAHRRHLDHSPAFHAHHAAILGERPHAANLWLKRHGAALQVVGGAGVG